MRKIYSRFLAIFNKSAIAFLIIAFFLIFKGEQGFGQTFTTTQVWNCPAGVTSITVECLGGGGAGGGATGNPSAGGGGGGGSYVKNTNISVVPGTNYTITVGAAVAGGSAAGANGNPSWFGSTSTIFATGGNGGSAAASNSQTAAGAPVVTTGNVGATAPFSYYGGAGGTGGVNGASGGGGGSSAGTGSNGNAPVGIIGGIAPAGGFAGSSGSASSADGTDNTIGGGGAGARAGNTTNRNGGNGGRGQVVITYNTYKVSFSNLSYGASTWCAGETRNVTIRITNTGTAPWTSAAAASGINLSYWWSNQSGQDANPRIYPFSNLVPGAFQDVTVAITAPSGASPLTLNFDLVKEGYCWFRGNTPNCTGPGNPTFVSPSITINALPGSPAGSTAQSFCANINPTVANLTATGTNIKWYFTATGGTALVTTISLVNGTHYYASQTNASGCESTSRLDVTVTVNADATISLSSVAGTDNQTKCINAPITNITYAIGGGGTGASISAGALPAGVTGSYNAGTKVFTMSGTPTASGTFNYTITTAGPCINNSLSGTITVTANGTIALSSAVGTAAQTICITNPITDITYNIGGTSNGASITAGALPAGVTGSFAAGVFTITGTPTVSGTFNYTVGASGSTCINPSLSGTITVNDNGAISLSSAVGTDNQTICAGNALVNITYGIGGVGTTGASITAGALPSGITGNYSAGTFTISGTSLAVGTYNYTVTTSGPCINNSLSGSFTITTSGTVTRSSASGTDAQTRCINTAITDITYVIGGDASGASITAGALPAGVTGTYDGTSGVFTITGTPTTSGVFNYTLTASGSSCTNLSASGTITVNADATITLTSAAGTDAQTLCINTPLTAIKYTVGGSATGASITAGALPAGVTGTYNSGTKIFTISGTPTVSGTFNYTVTTAGPCTNVPLSGTITVQANSTITLTSAPGSNIQTKCINNAITTITYSIGGGGTGASLTSGSFPAGVTGSFAAGVFTISGTPTASGTFNYTITTTGPCVNPAASGTITVNPDATITFTSAAGTDNQTKCISTAITPITYAVGGSGTGASITAGALPAGVTGTYNSGTKIFTISGTPTVSGTFNYTVTTAGPCTNVPLSGTIMVQANSTISLTSGIASQTVCINTAITTINYTVGGSATGASLTSGSFPAGVTGSFAGGVFTISGTPTVSGSFPYTITTAGPCTNTSVSGTITINVIGSWLGGTSPNWFTASNWGCGQIPDATIDVTIPASAPNMPNIGSVGAVCRSITNNGTLTITGANNLDVYGDWTNNGTFDGTSAGKTSSVTFKGATNNTMAGSNATTFYNLIISKSATPNTLTSTTKAFTATNLTITQGDLILQSIDANYIVTNDIIVSSNGILTHSANWDVPGKLLSVGGNIAIDGIFNYTTRSHVQMYGSGKTVYTGTKPGSAFSILTLISTGNVAAGGTLTINDNFWAMFGTPGSFSTGTNTVYANAALLMSNGSVNINGGTLNVTGGMFIGNGNAATATLSSGSLNVISGGVSVGSGGAGTMNITNGTATITGGMLVGNSAAGTVNLSGGILTTDALTIGTTTVTINGTFNHSGGTTNINGNILINNTTTASVYNCTFSPVINITGNWTNNETFNAATSQVNFNGSALQTISGSVATTFYNFKINNPAGATLGINTTVSNTLDLTSGIITTVTNTLTSSSTLATAIINYNASSYVNGKLARGFVAGPGSKVFPIGKGGNYRPLTFAYTASSAVSTITTEQFESAISGTVTPSTVTKDTRYWEITKTGTGSINYTVTLDPTYSPAPAGSIVQIIKKEGNLAATALTATAAITPNYTNGTAFSTFNSSTTASGTNQFALGSDCSSTAKAGTALTAICQGGTSAPLGGSVTGTANGGIWDDGGVGGTFNPNATTLNATWTPPAAYSGTATLTLKPTGGICTPNTPDSKIQLVNALPILTSSLTPPARCSGVAGTYTATGATSYTWTRAFVTGISNPAGNGNSGTITETLVNITTSPINVIYSITLTTSGCSNTQNVTVTVNPKPTAGAITSDPQNVCVGGTLQLVPAASGIGALSYTWTSADPSIASVSNAGPTNGLVTGINVGSSGYETVDFTYKVTDANGCTSASSAAYTVAVSKPIANGITQAATQTAVCIGSTLALTPNGIGAGTLAYTWASSNTSRATVDNSGIVTGIAATPPAVSIAYTVTDGYGCSTTSAPYAITVNALPSGTFTASATSVCPATTVTFTFLPAGLGSYIFKVNGVTKQTGTSNIFNTSTLANGNNVTVDVANASNCGATFGPINITVNPLPTPTLSADKTTICPGDLVTFTAGTVVVGNTYNFKLNGSSIQSGSSNIYSTTTFTAANNPVTVDVTNTNGCMATSAPVSVTVNPVPAGTLTSTATSICPGGSITFTATSGFASYEFFVNGVSQGISGNTFTTTTLTNPSVVTVNATNASGCTKTFNSIAVTVNPLPAGTIAITENSGAINNNEICLGSSATYTFSNSSYTTYVWKINGTTKTGSGNIFTTTELTTSADVVTVTVTSGSGCTATFTASPVTIVPSPTGTLSVSPSNVICEGDNVVFTVAPLDPSFTYTFKVNGTTVQNGVGNNTFTTTTLGVGTYPVTVDITNSSSCVTTSNAISMTVNALPTSTVTPKENYGIADDGIICEGGTVIFTVPTGFANYNFLLNGVSVQNGSSRTFNNTDYSITLVTGDKVTVAITNAGGCIGLTNEVTITVNPLPVLPAITDGAPQVCVNSLTPAFTNTQAGGVWSLTNGTGTATITSGSIVKGLTPGLVTINYTYTNGNGCTSTVSTSITVNPLPVVAAITGNVNICTGTTTQFNDATPGGVWSSVDPSVASVDPSGMVTGEAIGNTSIRYTVTDPTTGCATTVGINVTVNSAPIIADITPGMADICIGGTVTLADLTPGGVWSSADDGIATVSTSGLVTGIMAGTVTISYTVTTTCGAPFIKTATVTVHDLPTAVTASGSGTFCGSTTITAANGANGTIYFQGTASNGTSTATASASQVVSASGTYYFRAQSAAGCWGPQGSVTVTINPVPAITTVSGAGTFCVSTSITAAGGAGGTIYFQGTTTGGTSTALGGTPQTIIASGTYYFRSKSAAGCWGPEGSVTVTINAIPAVTTVSGGGAFCGSTSISAGGGAGGTIYFQGTTTGGTSIVLGGTPQTITTSGTYYFRSKSAAGCWGPEGSVTVTVNPLPTATISGTIAVCKNATAPTITFTGSGGTAPYIFTYKINGGSNLTVTSVGNTATVTAPTGTVGSFVYTLTNVKDASSTTCSNPQSGTATVTVNDIPTISVIPVTATLCQSTIQSLTATATGTPAPQTQSFTSGTINVSIPDATNGGPGERNTTLAISGIPATATITNISVTLNISHNNDGELNFNIKAPNGNILNLINRKGGSTGQNFINTIIAMNGGVAIPATGAPYTGIYSPDAAINIGPAGNKSNANNFSLLAGILNGNWTLYAEDNLNNSTGGTINSWSIKLDYTVPTSNPVTWSPATDLYTDASATIPYTGQSLTTVYANPSSPGTKVYTATATNASSCTNTATATLTVGAPPVVTISANYCAVPGQVVLTANSTGVTYLWDNGKTTDTIHVDESGDYSVTVTNTQGCKAFATISVSKELVTNGDFEAGDGVGFTTLYTSHTGNYFAGNTTTNGAGSGLWPEGDYAVDYSAYSPSNNIGYHTMFHGRDHTTGSGKFMMINGAIALRTIWQETVTVLPNTTYYFSAWGMNLNPGSPAQLQFAVNGDPAGGIGDLNLAPKPGTEGQVNLANWIRFYGTWTSGPSTTSAVINIVNLNTIGGGNDFGLDDISFATLSTFIDLISAPGTDAQSVCVNTPLVNIVYRAGNGNPTGPTVTGLPAGVTSSFAGDKLTFTGTPTVPGNYTYTITTTGCAPYSVTGTINVQAQKIALASGSASPSVCVNNPVSIGFTLSGTATDATTTGLPAGVNGVVSGSGPTYTYTISGTPTVAGVYPYTITTIGTCAPVTTTGTITVTAQTITLNSANDVQTVCINSPISNIQYTIGGTGLGVVFPVTGLPAGVSGSYSNGILFISGTPTASGTFNYTVTTSGTCAPVTASGTITVTPAASLTLTSANNTQTVCINTAVGDITYTINNGTGATATGLPAGVSLSVAGTTATISGTPTVAGTFNYTISTTGGCGTGTATGTITVQSQTITLASGASSPTICVNQLMTPNIVYTIGGTSTGATVTGLPPGMTYAVGTNTVTISGTPTTTAGSPFTYTVTVSGTCATQATATGTITVQPTAIGGTIASVSVCSGGSAGTLTLLGQTGTIVRWEYSDDNGGTWVTIANITPSQGYPSLTAARMYRVVVGNGCGNVFSSVATVGIHNLWTGAISTDWNTAGNWSDNLVPSVSCPMVIIPQVPTNRYPILSTGAMATIINLDIKLNASLTVSGNTIQIKGSIANAGAFDVTAGTLELNGSSLQTIDGNTFVAHTIQNLTISNNVTVNVTGLNDTLKISGQLGFGAVSGKTFDAGANNVTLLSSINGTANVGQILSNNVISGTNFTVERYIATGTGSAPNHGKSWQLLAVPTTGQTIKASWQEGATASNQSAANSLPGSPGNLHKGYGTMLTSAVAGAASQPTPGFDAFTAPGPSIKTYAYLTNGYDNGPSSTANQLYNKKGYIILVRGDRSVYTSNGAATPTVLRSTGTLFTPANKPPADTVKAGYMESIGNPYPSSLDLHNIARTGSQDEFIYVWDPRLGGSSNLGAYQVLGKLHQGGASDDNYEVNPGGGSYGAFGSVHNFIQSGQAFIVQATGSDGIIKFDESAKAGGSALLFTPNQPPQSQKQLRTSLYTLSSDGSTSMADGVLSQFNDGYSNAIDGLDARKTGNTGENLSIKTQGRLLSIERKHTITQNDTIFLNLTGVKLSNYRFEFVATDLDKADLNGNNGGLQGYVEDTYLHTSTPLNLSGTNTVDFTIVNIPGSYAPDRFRIVFTPLKVLPVTFTSVKAYRQASNINVEWKVSNEFNIKQYDVEKSINGLQFTTLATKAPLNNQGAAANYYTADSKPADGYNYYRIRSVDIDGKVQYTSVVKVFMGGGKPEITIYPNPITDGIINLHLTNLPEGQYGIRLLNKLGQVIVSKNVNHAEGSSVEPIRWDYNLAHGLYTLEVTNPDGTKKNLNVMY